jgi:Pectate lyase superfamily protein
MNFSSTFSSFSCRRFCLHFGTILLLGTASLLALNLAPLTTACAAETNTTAAPKLFWGSDPINAGETAMLYGDGIATNVTAEGWRLTDDAVTTPPAKEEVWTPSTPGTALEVLQASGECAKAVLSKEWSAGIFAVRLKNGATTAEPYLLNRPELWWWLGGENDLAYAGEELRVFGKNFGEKTRVWLVSESGQATALTMLKAEKYAVKCQLPKELPAGKYSVWLHNGFGGKAGFGKPLMVTVAQRTPWPTTRFNVKDFGAKGDFTTDDTGAIEAALAAARNNGGGIVYLPRGQYKICGELIMPAKTILKGESRESVELLVPWITTDDFDAVIAGDGDFGVEDMAITALTARMMVRAPLMLGEKIDFKKTITLTDDSTIAHNIHLRRLTLREMRESLAVGPVPMRSSGGGIVMVGKDLEISDCDIMSTGGSLLLSGRRLDVERNKLSGGRYTLETEEMVWEGNSVKNGGMGIEGKVYRLYIAGNTNLDDYMADRESMTFDVPYGHSWMGQILPSSPTVMKVPEGVSDVWGRKWKPGAYKGQGVMIVSGKGLGQFIRIVDNTETTLTLEHPWVIQPDTTSWVVVRTIKNQVVLTGNHYENNGKAIQLYANSYGFIMDGNTAVRSGGIYGNSRDYIRGGSRRCYSSCAFNQFLNNTIAQGMEYARDGIVYGQLGVNADYSTLTNPVTVSAMGNVVRNNTVSGDVMVGMGRETGVTPRPSLIRGRDTVIEGNRISDTLGSGTNASLGEMKAMSICGLFQDTLLRSNQVAPCPVPLNDDGKNTWIHPAERLGYQIESARSVLGDLPELQAIRSECAALLPKPVDSTLNQDCDALREKLWTVVASKSSQLPGSLLTSLAGLRYEFSKNTQLDTLMAGNTGSYVIGVNVRTEPWSPPVSVQAAFATPVGWPSVTQSPAVNLSPNKGHLLMCRINVPSGNTLDELPLEIGVSLGKNRLIARDVLPLNRLELNNWLVSSADTAGGWKPLPSVSNTVNFGALVSETSPSLYLVSGFEAKESSDVLLNIGCKGTEATFFLNDQPVASLSQHSLGHSGGAHRDSTVRVHLEKGVNILLCKASVGASAEEQRVSTIRAAIVTDPGQKGKVGLRLLPVEETPNQPMMHRGKAAAAAAMVQPMDDLHNAQAEGWKFTEGSCRNLQVVESGDPARGKVLKRELNNVTDQQKAELYREIAPGSLSETEQGIRIWLKTSYPVWVDLVLSVGSTQFVAKVKVGTDWEEYRVPFDKFIKSSTADSPLALSDLKNIKRLTVTPRNDDGMWTELTLFISDLGVMKQPSAPTQTR